MRMFVLAAVALLSQASAAAIGDSALPVETPALVTAGNAQAGAVENTEAGECRRPTSYKADTDLEWRGDRVDPRKLTELPPANSYMAVYRTVNGCEEPMTVIEYRNSGRR